MCDKTVEKCPFVFDSVPDQYKTQELCDRAISKDPFMLAYCSDRYKTQRICGEAVDDCLAASKFIPDCFVTSKIIKKLLTVLYTDGNIHYFN